MREIGVVGLGQPDGRQHLAPVDAQAGHSCVVWDANPAAVQGLGKEGAQGATAAWP